MIESNAVILIATPKVPTLHVAWNLEPGTSWFPGLKLAMLESIVTAVTHNTCIHQCFTSFPRPIYITH